MIVPRRTKILDDGISVKRCNGSIFRRMIQLEKKNEREGKRNTSKDYERNPPLGKFSPLHS
jgi:hypothetical protein